MANIEHFFALITPPLLRSKESQCNTYHILHWLKMLTRYTHCVYFIVVTWVRVIFQKYSQKSKGAARGLWAYISGKSRVPLLQLLCNTFVKADSLNANMSGITGFVIYAYLKDSCCL